MESLLYSAPGLIALAGKILILVLYRSSMLSFSVWFLSFILFMLCTNILELAILNHSKVNVNGYILIITYYFFAISAALSLFAFALELNKASKKQIAYIVGPMYLLAQASLLSGYGIVGYEDIGYSLTRVAGDFYWIIQIVLMSSFGMTIYTLIACYRKESNSWLCKNRARILLAALLPVLVAMTFVVTVMQIGFKLNATVILSVFSTLMILVIVYTESASRVSLFMSKWPGTDLYKINARIKALTEEGKNLKEIGRLQQLYAVILHKNLLDNCDDSINVLAEKFDVSYHTIKRRLNEADEIINPPK